LALQLLKVVLTSPEVGLQLLLVANSFLQAVIALVGRVSGLRVL